MSSPDHGTKERTPVARERGQILVIFAISLVALIGMVGLVLDGGSAYAQRRVEQNVSDLAAIAGATAYLNTTGSSAVKGAAAEAAARSIASTNGFTHDQVAGLTVDVTVAASSLAASVQVDVTKPHRNNFAAVMGMPVWPVSVTATAISSDNPNAVIGAMPLIFNQDAFAAAGTVCNEDVVLVCQDEVYQMPGNGNEDVPQDATQFNWTIYCTANGNNPCNANSDGVRAIIDGGGESTTIDLGDDIGPLNAGAHTTLFGALELHIGELFPVPIVDDDGAMVGFAYFRLTGVEGASDKVIRGYFASPINGEEMVIDPTAPVATLDTGISTIKLTN